MLMMKGASTLWDTPGGQKLRPEPVNTWFERNRGAEMRAQRQAAISLILVVVCVGFLLLLAWAPQGLLALANDN
jgi:hypothetical protein